MSHAHCLLVVLSYMTRLRQLQMITVRWETERLHHMVYRMCVDLWRSGTKSWSLKRSPIDTQSIWEPSWLCERDIVKLPVRDAYCSSMYTYLHPEEPFSIASICEATLALHGDSAQGLLGHPAKFSAAPPKGAESFSKKNAFAAFLARKRA